MHRNVSIREIYQNAMLDVFFIFLVLIVHSEHKYFYN